MGLETFFPSTVAGAIVGSFVGSAWAFGWAFNDGRRGGVRRFVIEAVFAALGAAAIAEQLLIYQGFWSAAMAGSGVGLLWGRVLEIVNAIAPALLEQSIKSIIGKWLGNAPSPPEPPPKQENPSSQKEP